MSRLILDVFEPGYNPLTAIANEPSLQGLELGVIPWLLFRGMHNFEHMYMGSCPEPFQNGYYKMGTIRFSEGKVLLPLCDEVLAFESSEYSKGMRPRRNIRLEQAVICPLEELTDEEIWQDGFETREDMLWQMTEMEGRHYSALKPDSIITYLSWGSPGPFWGADDARIAIYFLQKSGHWDQLKQIDKTGWTNNC